MILQDTSSRVYAYSILTSDAALMTSPSDTIVNRQRHCVTSITVTLRDVHLVTCTLVGGPICRRGNMQVREILARCIQVSFKKEASAYIVCAGSHDLTAHFQKGVCIQHSHLGCSTHDIIPKASCHVNHHPQSCQRHLSEGETCPQVLYEVCACTSS